MHFVVKVILNGIAILAATWMLPGLHLSGPGAALGGGAVLGLVNALVRPVLIVLTFPLTLVTLGLFIFVVNALCFGLTAWLIPGFGIDGFWWAVIGSLVVSVVSWILNGLLLRPTDRTRRPEL